MAILGPDKSGRYTLRYYTGRTLDDGTRERVQEKLKVMPYAQVKKEHAEREAQKGEERESRRVPTVGELADDYLETHGRKLTALGYERAAAIVANDIKADPIGAIVAGELKTWHIDDWQDRLTEAGDSDATLDRKGNVLRAVILHAVRRGRLRESPLRRGVDLKRRVESTAGKVIWFEQPEMQSFLGAFDDLAHWRAYVDAHRTLGPVKIGEGGKASRRHGGGLKADSEVNDARRKNMLAMVPFWRALLLTGCRLSEIRLLQWENVDLRNRVIVIPQTKTDKPKTLPIGATMVADLESLPRGIGKTYVFGRNGSPLTKAVVSYAFRLACKVAPHVHHGGCRPDCKERFGLRRELTIHSIRHTTASWRVQRGASLKEVQELLGHRSPVMTNRYAHLAPDHLRAAVSELEGMMTGSDDVAKEKK